MQELPRREPTQDELEVLAIQRADKMQRVATVQKGEIWEIGPWRYKVTKSLKGGKTVYLRRLQDAAR